MRAREHNLTSYGTLSIWTLLKFNTLVNRWRLMWVVQHYIIKACSIDGGFDGGGLELAGFLPNES